MGPTQPISRRGNFIPHRLNVGVEYLNHYGRARFIIEVIPGLSCDRGDEMSFVGYLKRERGKEIDLH